MVGILFEYNGPIATAVKVLLIHYTKARPAKLKFYEEHRTRIPFSCISGLKGFFLPHHEPSSDLKVFEK